MKNWFKVFFVFFVLGLLIYSNSFKNKFLIDDFVFLANPVLSQSKYLLTQWDPYREQAVGVQDSQERLGYYRPMAHMVLNLSYATFKNHYWKYHLFNLLIFVFSSSLIFLFIQKAAGNYQLAFLTGLFYLIHPINGIVVNYISASVFAFQVIFMMGTLLLLLGSLERKNDRIFYFLSLLSCFLSLFWNESGIMVPFYICAVIFLFRKEALKKKVLYLIPYFLIIFSYIIFRFNFISINKLIFKKMMFYSMNGGEYLATLFQVYAWYIGKLFYPLGIVMQWATPIVRGHIILNVSALILLLGLFLLFFVRFYKEKVFLLGLAWIFIGFAPVCVAAFRTPEHGALIEPHWFIFSSIGFFILAAYCCSIVLERTKNAGFLFLFILILSWGMITHAGNQLWADQKTYAVYWVKQDPYLKSTYNYLAQAYEREGDYKKSIKYFRMALTGTFADLDTYNNLAALESGKQALSDCEMALKIDPYSAVAYNNLGAIYYAQGQLDKAKKNFNRALMFNPFLMQPRIGLALVLLKHAEYQQAIGLCMLNLNIVNDDPDTLGLLIDIYVYKKDLTNLDKYAHRLINAEIDPEKLTKLGVQVAQVDPQLALGCFTKAIHVAPDFKDAYLAAGALFANLGKFDEAIRIWQAGSTIEPSDQRFKKDIAKVEALKLL